VADSDSFNLDAKFLGEIIGGTEQFKTDFSNLAGP